MQRSFAINYTDGRNVFESTRKEFISFSPITIEGKNLYMFVSGIPEGEVMYDTKEGPFRFNWCSCIHFLLLYNKEKDEAD